MTGNGNSPVGVAADVLKQSDLTNILQQEYFNEDRRDGLVVLVNLSLETFDPGYPPEKSGDGGAETNRGLDKHFWFRFYAGCQAPRRVALYLPVVRRRDSDGRYRLHLSEWLGRSSLARMIQEMERQIDSLCEEKRDVLLGRFRCLCKRVRVYLHAETREPDDDEVDYAFAMYYGNNNHANFFDRLSHWHEEPRGCRDCVRRLMQRPAGGDEDGHDLLLLLATSTGDPFCVREKAFGEASFRYNLLMKFGEEAIAGANCGNGEEPEATKDPTHCAVCEHLLLLHKIHQQRVNFPQRILSECPANWREDYEQGGVKGAVGLGALFAWIASEFDLSRSWCRIVRAMEEL